MLAEHPFCSRHPAGVKDNGAGAAGSQQGERAVQVVCRVIRPFAASQSPAAKPQRARRRAIPYNVPVAISGTTQRLILSNGKRHMLYKLGRFLQGVGLFVLIPLGVAGNLARPDQIDLRMSLTISGIGVAIFVLGYLLQQAGKKT
jgi:hypothetical protein